MRINPQYFRSKLQKTKWEMPMELVWSLLVGLACICCEFLYPLRRKSTFARGWAVWGTGKAGVSKTRGINRVWNVNVHEKWKKDLPIAESALSDGYRDAYSCQTNQCVPSMDIICWIPGDCSRSNIQNLEVVVDLVREGSRQAYPHLGPCILNIGQSPEIQSKLSM